MTGETNTHHVVNFALVPVGGGPKMNDRCYFRMFLRYSGFQPEVNVRIHRVKLIDNLKPRLITEVIDTGKVGKKIESELLLGKLTGWLDLREHQFKSDFAAKIGSMNDLEPILEFGNGFLEAHEKTSDSSLF